MQEQFIDTPAIHGGRMPRAQPTWTYSRRLSAVPTLQRTPAQTQYH